MSKMVVTPRPPSTTGTTTWLISSTSPACNTAPLNVPPPSSISRRTPCTPVGDVVGPLDAPARLLEPHIASRELAHGGGAYQPGADPEAVRGALEEFRAVLPAWQRRPAATEDAAVDGGAHVADDVGL